MISKNYEIYNAMIEDIANLTHEKFIEYASDLVHKDWLERNLGRAEGEHKLSYEQLSEEAREKDRIFVYSTIEIYKKFNH